MAGGKTYFSTLRITRLIPTLISEGASSPSMLSAILRSSSPRIRFHAAAFSRATPMLVASQFGPRVSDARPVVQLVERGGDVV